MARLKKGDQVIVIAGKDKGKRGRILKALPGKDRVFVEGVNQIKRHTKPTKDDQGGIVEKEASLHVSNVMLLDPSSGKGTRVGAKFLKDGRKVRVARGSGEVLDS